MKQDEDHGGEGQVRLGEGEVQETSVMRLCFGMLRFLLRKTDEDLLNLENLL